MHRRRLIAHPIGRLIGLLAAAALSLVPQPVQAQTLNGFDLRGALVNPSAIEHGGPPRDGIPAIDTPRHVSAEAAMRAGLRDDDRVLGIARGGIARAYPVRILNWHEVVNDRFGAEPIVITYCPLCGTGVAFEARIGGRAASFGVSGLLYNSDVLLYDRGTESLWSQLLEQAVTGPMKGTRLAPVPITHTSWADWRRRQPGTEVLSTDTGFTRDYGRDPYDGYDKVPRLMFEVQHRDERLPAKEWVLGVRLAGVAKAYPFSALAARAASDSSVHVLRDELGGQPIEIRFRREHRSAEAYDAKGQALPAVMAYWFAWFAFHPQTQVFALSAAADAGKPSKGR